MMLVMWCCGFAFVVTRSVVVDGVVVFVLALVLARALALALVLRARLDYAWGRGDEVASWEAELDRGLSSNCI